MSKISIIIPARNETYEIAPGVTVLERTIQDIYEKGTGNFEVIVAFDGPPYTRLRNYKNLTVLKLAQSGTKLNINKVAKIAKGKYIFKLDAHCMLSKGFDEVLQEKMEDNWVVTPRFYTLNAKKWEWQNGRPYDYFRLPCPVTDKRLFRFQAGGYWRKRTKERMDMLIDENMKLHGSSFFMNRDFFNNCIGGFDENSGAGTWSGEDIELSLKTWLGPWNGKLMVNKNCWYAHMHKGKGRLRGFKATRSEINKSYRWTAKYWMGNKWEERAHDIKWLIDRFSPVPGWPDDWEKLLEESGKLI